MLAYTESLPSFKCSSVTMYCLQAVHLMHKSFVTTAPHLWGRVGDSRAKVRGNYFQVSPLCRGNDGVLTLGSLPQGDVIVRMVGQRAKF